MSENQLSRAERLKQWQSLKKSKLASNETSISVHTSLESRKRNRKMKYVDTSQLRAQSHSRVNGSEFPLKSNLKRFIENTSSQENLEPNSSHFVGDHSSMKGNSSFEIKCEDKESCIINRKIEPSSQDGYLTANDEDDSSEEETPIKAKERRSNGFLLKMISGATSCDEKSPPSAVPDNIKDLRSKLTRSERDNTFLREQLALSSELCTEAKECSRMVVAENQAWIFHNDILLQRISDLETKLNSERMRNHEKDCHKSDRHREEMQKLKTKNLEYEKRANAMVAEMSQQMSQLQDMAMKRIEVMSAFLSFILSLSRCPDPCTSNWSTIC
jgi:primosomal protein N''